VSIKSRIRTIPDYPKPGIQFRDITTLLQDAEGLRLAIDRLVEPFQSVEIEKVAGIEARGFILGGAAAHQLRAGFVPIRKKGKLPWKAIGQDYDLEYGSDRIEMHEDAVGPGEQVLLVDDLIATGGTAEASIRVIERAGGRLVGVAVVVELPDLGGRGRIEALGHKLVSLCTFQGD
jgi:adenine phosphoribosyltransferase